MAQRMTWIGSTRNGGGNYYLAADGWVYVEATNGHRAKATPAGAWDEGYLPLLAPNSLTLAEAHRALMAE
jgi:hypothetical protein